MRLRARAKRLRPACAALALAGLLSACSAAIDHIPTALGGLPEGVPARSAQQPGYPAVHDMPPQRNDAALSDTAQKQLQQDLIKIRAQTQKAGAESTPGTTASAGTTGKP